MLSYEKHKRQVDKEILECLRGDLSKEKLKLLELIEEGVDSTLSDLAIAASIKRYVALSKSIRRLKEELTRKKSGDEE